MPSLPVPQPLNPVLSPARALRNRLYRVRDRLSSIAEPAAQLWLRRPLVQATRQAGEQLRDCLDMALWRKDWERYDLDYLPKGQAAVFMSARQALRLITPGQTVLSSGFGATGRCSLFFWGLRDSYRATGYPHSLRWMSVSAQGGRGLLPGTVEELALPGLLRTYCCGHMESASKLLQLAQNGELDLQTLPQGVMAQLIELQAQGVSSMTSSVGLGCFFDPRVGHGSAVTASDNQWVAVKGEQLAYSLPKIDVALIAASYADRLGNIYFTDLPTVSEHCDAAAAAHANGGKVLVTVGALVAVDEAAIAIPAAQVDAVVVNPWQEQIAGVRLADAWPVFFPDTKAEPQDVINRMRLINSAAMVAGARGEPEQMLAKQAAEQVLQSVPNGGLANVGVGMPEEVAYHVQRDARSQDLIFTSEAGVYGGLPGPGMFFGVAVKPLRIESSSWMFKRYTQGLDVAVLGFLQVDSQGNVNVSHRGHQPRDFVGAGGFCDIAEAARTLVFVGSWMVRGQYRVHQGEMQMLKRGKAKFVGNVEQICFNGQRALEQGKQVYYASNVGVFKLTRQGLVLQSLMPGIDLARDVLAISEATIIVPEHLSASLPGKS